MRACNIVIKNIINTINIKNKTKAMQLPYITQCSYTWYIVLL